jgi:hypothetical protein
VQYCAAASVWLALPESAGPFTFPLRKLQEKQLDCAEMNNSCKLRNDK